jgi:hypothetical protein
MTNVYVKNDSNGPLIVGIVIVILVLIALWWFLFAGGSGGGTPAATNNPGLPQITNPLPQGS